MQRVYKLRWILALAIVAVAIGSFVGGVGRVAKFTKQVDSLSDEPPAKSEPRMFDPRTDIWFDSGDPALAAFRDLEARFVGEDPVLVAFTTTEPDGVFSVKSLQTIARLTEAIKKVPYVRTVRSLTDNPWIRWGHISAGSPAEPRPKPEPKTNPEPPDHSADKDTEDDADESDDEGAKAEMGLIVSDLFEKDPATYTQRERHERMISVLGARNSIGLIGEARVREIIGKDANLDDYIGEPRLLENVLSVDGRSTALVVQLIRPRLPDDRLDDAFGAGTIARKAGPAIHASVVQTEALHGIQALLAKDNSYDYKVTGIPVMQEHFQKIAKKDMSFIGLMFLVIGVILLIIYRRVAGFILPLLTVFISILGMLGVILLKGDLINGLTAMTPHMLVAIGVANAVHLVTAYYYLRPNYDDKHELVKATMRFNALPVFLTSATTAVGFLSLATSSIFPMRQFGYTAAIGTVFAYLLSMTLVPSILSLIKLKPIKESKKKKKAKADDDRHWSDPLADWVFAKRLPIVIAGAALAGLAAFGLTQVNLTSDMRLMFGKNDPVVTAVQWLDEKIGGTGDLEILFEGASTTDTPEVAAKRQARITELGIPKTDKEKAELARLTKLEDEYKRGRIADSAKFLVLLDKFQRRLEASADDPKSPLRIFTSFDSALGVLRKIHQVQNKNQGAFYRVPTEADVPPEARKPTIIRDEVLEEDTVIPAQTASTMVAQYYLQFENGAQPEDNLSSTLITPDRRTFRVTMRTRAAGSKNTVAAYNRMLEIAKKEFPQLIGSREDVESGKALSSMSLTGNYYMQMNMISAFSNTLIVSLSLALLVITLIITLVFRSITIGLVSMIPNVLPIMLPLGALALLGVPMDGPAILVAAVGLGICVDDTVHFLTKYTRARKAGKETRAAIRQTFRDVGGALTYTSIVLVFGFSMMTFATFRPNVMIGFLGAAMIGLAWVADFILTPAVLSYIPVKDSQIGHIGEETESDD